MSLNCIIPVQLAVAARAIERDNTRVARAAGGEAGERADYKVAYAHTYYEQRPPCQRSCMLCIPSQAGSANTIYNASTFRRLHTLDTIGQP